LTPGKQSRQIMQQYTWFYSLANTLTPEQETALKADFDQFLSQWKTHGTPVDGMIQIRHQRFVIIQSNPAEGRPSGCSIDSLKKAVGQILNHHGLQALESSQVFFRNNGDGIQSTDFRQIPELVKSGTLSPETLIFDHSLAQSDDLSKWEVPLKQTWLKRYL
jgi:hypothetical protein